MTFTSLLESPVRSLAQRAHLRINGDRSFDPQIPPHLIPQLAVRVLLGGSRAWGEAYMDGWWTADDVTELTARLLEYRVAKRPVAIPEFVLRMQELFRDRQSAARSVENIQNHYDAGEEFFGAVLGKPMVYSCGYAGRGASSLSAMQRDKMDLTIEKTAVRPGDTLLDVGCGYGELLYRAATKYGARAYGVTLSEDQFEHGIRLCEGVDAHPLKMNYLDMLKEFGPGYFKRIVSVGMFEHVGPEHYREYFQTIHDLLDDDGVFTHHSIYTSGGAGRDPWIDAYIFRGGVLPRAAQVDEAIEGLFEIRDVHEFGRDYYTTNLYWLDNLVRHKEAIVEQFGIRFYRMMHYAYSIFAACFKTRRTLLQQRVLVKPGTHLDYKTVR
jgi:cyclopropane-fatty-acyl-phospholipid synthase